MKIKTITCHEVYNYGASLQEYALLYFLNQLGYQAEAIHYKPDYLSRHFYLWAVNNPKFNIPIIKQLYLLVKLPNRLKILPRTKAFDRFHEKYIPTGTVKYTTNEELINNLPDADVFICGSDQIWNSFFQNGKDPAFYLNFVPDEKKKIAYAASFAIDLLEEAVKPLVRKNVSRLDFIGVRETSGVRILNELGIAKAVQVLDPVFLLEKEHWKSEFIHMIDEKYVFVYDFDSNYNFGEGDIYLESSTGNKIQAGSTIIANGGSFIGFFKNYSSTEDVKVIAFPGGGTQGINDASKVENYVSTPSSFQIWNSPKDQEIMTKGNPGNTLPFAFTYSGTAYLKVYLAIFNENNINSPIIKYWFINLQS